MSKRQHQHNHLHNTDYYKGLYSALDYLEDNAHRRNILKQSWESYCPVCGNRPYTACYSCYNMKTSSWDDEDGDWEQDLNGYLQNSQDIYPWSRGNHGKWLMTPQGEFVHWQTDEYGMPHHDSVAGEWGKDQAIKGDIAPNGAWWMTDNVNSQNPDQLMDQAVPQAQEVGMRTNPHAYMAKHTETCSTCGLPYNQCQCKTTWFEDPISDPVADLTPNSGTPN